MTTLRKAPSLQWTARRRQGLPHMTHRMFDILIRLRDAKAAGEPLVRLDGVNHRTIRSMLGLTGGRDWIVDIAYPNGTFYRITRRGEEALATYAAPPRYHYDGTCPRCNRRPRATFKKGARKGKRKPYCKQCESQMAVEEYARNANRKDPNAPCCRCHKRQKTVFASGFVRDYCPHCLKIVRRQERKRKHKRRLWLIGIGKSPTCIREGCEQPIYHTENTTYDYCREHYYEQQRARRQVRKQQLLATGTTGRDRRAQ